MEDSEFAPNKRKADLLHGLLTELRIWLPSKGKRGKAKGNRGKSGGYWGKARGKRGKAEESGRENGGKQEGKRRKAGGKAE